MTELRGFERYAIYLAPEADDPLGHFCNGWLGYRPDTGETVSRPEVSGLSSSEIETATAAPRRYGFHGTLKAPFRLSEDKTVEEIDRHLTEFAGDRPRLDPGQMKVGAIGRFVAIVPATESRGIGDLAGACVTTFDPYRAELTDAERERRLTGGLTARQQELLDTWGYPYVLDEFRFHMTLTGPLEPEMLDVFTAGLATALREPLGRLVGFSDICLFGDPGNGRPFRLLRRYALARSARQ